MRTTKELLQLVDHNLVHLKSGLCYLVCDLHMWKDISDFEMRQLHDFILENRPRTWWRLWNSHSYFYWIPGAIKPRRRWLKKQINKLP
jgi:hypothetical protein